MYPKWVTIAAGCDRIDRLWLYDKKLLQQNDTANSADRMAAKRVFSVCQNSKPHKDNRADATARPSPADAAKYNWLARAS
jgi:hypothetical protein